MVPLFRLGSGVAAAMAAAAEAAAAAASALGFPEFLLPTGLILFASLARLRDAEASTGSSADCTWMSPSASSPAQKRRNAIAFRDMSSECGLLVNATRQFTQSVKVVVSVSVMNLNSSLTMRSTVLKASRTMCALLSLDADVRTMKTLFQPDLMFDARASTIWLTQRITSSRISGFCDFRISIMNGLKKSFWKLKLASSSMLRNLIASWRSESTAYMPTPRFSWQPTLTKKSDSCAQILPQTIRIRPMLKCAISTIWVRLKTRGVEAGSSSSMATAQSACTKAITLSVLSFTLHR
mmetsp:Transcript_5155/g.14767  ORF Transcript_5155/g.14767 Transcript_5155/m.14767 type:complete len:295 (-) Transcript_5155:2742-3626(-)